MVTWYKSWPIKFVIGLSLGLFISIMTSVNTTLMWVATGPRSLNAISPYIEAALAQEQYDVDIGETWLVWDGWKNPVDIRLHKVSIKTKQGVEFSNFPEVSLGVHIPSFLIGEILPTSLTIKKPIISLLQHTDKSINFGIYAKRPQNNPDTETKDNTTLNNTLPQIAAVFKTMLAAEDQTTFRKLKTINIHNADISIGNTTKGVFFTSSDTNINFRRNRRTGSILTHINGNIFYERYKTPLEATITITKDSPTINSDISFSGLVPSALSQLFITSPYIEPLNLPLSGKANILINKNGSIDNIGFQVDGGGGPIISDMLTGPLNVESLRAEGTIQNHLRDIEFKTFSAAVDGTWINADGAIFLGKEGDGDAAIHMNASIEKLPSDKIPLFWPPELAPLTRDWVVSNISKGHIPKASAQIDINVGELTQPTLSEKAVNVVIELQDAQVQYLDEHPPVHVHKALIHVNGMSLDARIASAQYMHNTQLNEAKVYIPNLHEDNPYIQVSLSCKSNGKDIAAFLALPRVQQAKNLNITPDNVKGNIIGTAHLGFKFFASEGDSPDDNITFDITAKADGLSHTGFMKKFNFSDAQGVFNINNKQIQFSGKGLVNGSTVNEAVVTHIFNPPPITKDTSEFYNTSIHVKAQAPTDSLRKLGYPIPSEIDGDITADAQIKLGNNIESVEGSFDLTNTAMTLKNYAWSKAKGEAVTLTFSSTKKGEMINIPTFKLTGDSINIKGSIKPTNNYTEFTSVRFEPFLLGKTNLKYINYEQVGEAQKLSFSGASFDATPWLKSKPVLEGEKAPDPFSLKHFPAIEINGMVQRLIFEEGRELYNVNSTLSCSKAICNSADITGNTIDEKPFNIRILRNPVGQRQLSISAENAGAFLKALNVVENMHEGVLVVTGNYDGDDSSSKLTAKAKISKYTLKDAPVLAKLLSMASLTGIFNSLQGNGIQFEKLIMPFTIQDDIVSFKDTKTYGSAIGLTAAGNINLPERKLNIEGTIVPSYTLNNVFGKLPLFGTILTGGDKGSGVFAARYSMKGDYTNPTILVNPLSILTPGFLRGMFDILDAPEDKPKPLKTEQPAPQQN